MMKTLASKNLLLINSTFIEGLGCAQVTQRCPCSHGPQRTEEDMGTGKTEEPGWLQ